MYLFTPPPPARLRLYRTGHLMKTTKEILLKLAKIVQSQNKARRRRVAEGSWKVREQHTPAFGSSPVRSILDTRAAGTGQEVTARLLIGSCSSGSSCETLGLFLLKCEASRRPSGRRLMEEAPESQRDKTHLLQ